MASMETTVTVALELTTPNNIAFLKQLTETLDVLHRMLPRDSVPCLTRDGLDLYTEAEIEVLNAIKVICTFPAQSVEGK